MEKTGPKDVFLHLLAILTLYASAIAFIALIFQYINVLIPDPLEMQGGYALQSSYQAIRWAIASLIVIFPVYIFSVWYLNKNYIASPEKRNLRIRKWLIYFTLFAAALIIIGDLVALIFNLLGGELTTRFLLKVLTVFFVAGSVFYYYLWDLRRHNIE
jgi:hypothetical protein